jgi:hypothetical protein
VSNGELISLDELCAQNAERFLSRLVQDLKERGGPTYRQMPIGVLESRVRRLFDAFWQAVAQNSSKPLTDYVWTTGRERGQEGFAVAELHSVALCFRETLLEAVDEAYADQPELCLRYSRQVEELVFSGISKGVQGFVDGREALITRQNQALRGNELPPE